jgi:hypothetical protein
MSVEILDISALDTAAPRFKQLPGFQYRVAEN